MLHNKVRLTALAGCAVSVLIIGGCGAREPVEAPPATIDTGYGAASTPALTPELMGGAASAGDTSPADGLLGGPSTAPIAATAPTPVSSSSNSKLTTWRRADGTLVTAMAPIANPKTKAHRSVRYAPRAVAAPARRTYPAPAPVAHPVAKPAPKPVVAVKPAPKPLPVAKPAPKPVAVAPAPAPLKPIVAAQPVAPLAKPPVVAPVAAAKPPVKTEPAKPLAKLQKLQAAIAPEATNGAVLASGESLAQGKEGQVTLSLPATLGDLIKKEAAKLGLTKAAKKTSAYADLQGEGYEITPNGRQTAVVKAGEPATFAWQVKPTPAAKGQLKTEFGVELGGAKPVQGFSLGSIAKQVMPIQEAIKAKTKGFDFAMPKLGKYESVDLPGVGKVPGKSILGGALVLLALLILVAISRNASAAKARAERRRKFRTLTDYGRNEMDFDAPKSAEVNYVNPMVAAAGGALAGAAVASAVSHHDDHGHAQEEHAPFDAPHDDHHVAPAPDAEALPVTGHDHAEAHGADHGHAPAEAAPHDNHRDDHGHGAHKELEHTH